MILVGLPLCSMQKELIEHKITSKQDPSVGRKELKME